MSAARGISSIIIFLATSQADGLLAGGGDLPGLKGYDKRAVSVADALLAEEEDLPGLDAYENRAISLADGILAEAEDLPGHPNYDDRGWGSPAHPRLKRAFEDLASGKSVTFAAAGGSATAGAGVAAENTWFGQVTEWLRNETGAGEKLVAHNAAQGFTNSFWSWMLMDSIVGDADVLFWEYGLNDQQDAIGPAMAQSIELWIRMARTLPSKPALVFLYLWDSHHNATYYSTALQYQKAQIQRLTGAFGLDALVLPSGPVMRRVNQRIVGNGTSDGKHPGEYAHRLIAGMLYRWLKRANASAVVPQQAQEERSRDVDFGQCFANSPLPSLVNFQHASTTMMRPRFGTIEDKVKLCPIEAHQFTSFTKFAETSVCDTALEGKASAGRHDRKVGVLVPRCWSRNVHQGLHVTLKGLDVCSGADVVALQVGTQGGSFLGGSLPLTAGIQLVNHQDSGEGKVMPFSDIGHVSDELSRHFNVITRAKLNGHGRCRVLSMCTPVSAPYNLTVYGAAIFY